MQENPLGEYLKTLRRRCGYSQEFVASKLNIIRQTYSHYETGRIMPPVDSLYHLSKLYNVRVLQTRRSQKRKKSYCNITGCWTAATAAIFCSL